MKAFCIMCGIRLKALFDNLRNLTANGASGTFQDRLEAYVQRIVMGKPEKDIEVDWEDNDQ